MKENEIKIIGKMDNESREEFKRETVANLNKEIEEIIINAKKHELPKTEEDLRMIEQMNLWTSQYLKDIGAEEFIKKVDPNQFIILSDDDFIKIGRDEFGSDWSHFSGKILPGADVIFARRLP